MKGADPQRPKTRGDCAGGVRPCPWASCRYHLATEVRTMKDKASRKHLPMVALRYPGSPLPGSQIDDAGFRAALEGWDPYAMAETCALDVADREGVPYSQVGDAAVMFRQRAEQTEIAALRHAKELSETSTMRAYLIELLGERDARMTRSHVRKR